MLCSGLACDSPEWQTLICNSPCILNKFIFAGEIYSSLFVLGEHFGGLQGGQRRCQSWFWNWWGNRCSRHLETKVTDFSLTDPEVWRRIFFSGSESMPSLCLKFSGFYSGSILKFCLSCVKALFCEWRLLWHFSLIWGSDFQLIPLGTEAISLKMCQIFSLQFISSQAELWRLAFSGTKLSP